MRKIHAAFPVMLAVAAVVAPAGAQEAPMIGPSRHQSGCTDITAEYMGCLNFGPSPEEVKSTLRNRAVQSHASIKLDATSVEPPFVFGSASVPHLRPSLHTVTTFLGGGNSLHVGAIGHIGAP